MYSNQQFSLWTRKLFSGRLRTGGPGGPLVHLNAVAADDHQLAAKVALRAKLQNDNQHCTERHTHNFAFAPLFILLLTQRGTRPVVGSKRKKKNPLLTAESFHLI
jgi:hypothetical protein